jgi:hypothetical protein
VQRRHWRDAGTTKKAACPAFHHIPVFSVQHAKILERACTQVVESECVHGSIGFQCFADILNQTFLLLSAAFGHLHNIHRKPLVRTFFAQQSLPKSAENSDLGQPNRNSSSHVIKHTFVRATVLFLLDFGIFFTREDRGRWPRNSTTSTPPSMCFGGKLEEHPKPGAPQGWLPCPLIRVDNRRPHSYPPFLLGSNLQEFRTSDLLLFASFLHNHIII